MKRFRKRTKRFKKRSYKKRKFFKKRSRKSPYSNEMHHEKCTVEYPILAYQDPANNLAVGYSVYCDAVNQTPITSLPAENRFSVWDSIQFAQMCLEARAPYR